MSGIIFSPKRIKQEKGPAKHQNFLKMAFFYIIISAYSILGKKQLF